MGTFPKALECHWYVVAGGSSVGSGPCRVRLLDADYVLWRGPDGSVVAARDVCPHRQSPLSEGTVEAGYLRCPYHGWTFDEAGQCVEVPSAASGVPVPPRAHLKSLSVLERYGLVWLCPGEPSEPVPAVVVDADPAYSRLNTEMQTWAASTSRMIDNFLDISHFPFTHIGTFGRQQETIVPRIELSQLDETFFGYAYEVVINNVGSTKVMSGGGDDIVTLAMSTGFALPFTVRSTMHYENGIHQVLLLTASPIDQEHSNFAFVIWRNDDVSLTGEEIVAFELEVVAEDRATLERLTGELPLWPGGTVDVQADKPSVEWRRRYRLLVEE